MSALPKWSLGFLICLMAQPAWAERLELRSPDDRIVFTLSDEPQLSYSVTYAGEKVMTSSRLGLHFGEIGDLGPELHIQTVDRASRDHYWQQPWGQNRQVRDHHNEALVSLQGDYRLNLRVRVFNDGVGFRYEIPKQDGLGTLTVLDELTEFNLTDASHTQAWWIPAQGWNRYEHLYQQTRVTDFDRVQTPVTFRRQNGTHFAIHEAALVDYASMTLDRRRGGLLKAELIPNFDGTKVKTQAGFHTPWRTIQIAGNATGLLNSNLVLNLNEPNKLGDVSWVKPGKYMGIWWGMHLGMYSWGSGEKHGATTANAKRYMDFAAEHGFDGVLVEGWNLGWDGEWFNNGAVFNFTQPYPDFDLEAVADYGRQLGVKLIGHHETSGHVTNYVEQMPDAYALYEKLGVEQIKTGYVANGGEVTRTDEQGIDRHEWHDSQVMVNHYLDSVKLAARHKISINTHEPIKATGLRRTYPNWLSREGARGQEFNAWGSPPNPPEHTVNLIYTRLLGGPMDFTPGIFNLAFNGLEAENRVQTTLAKQLALYVALYSPIQMAADLPEHYQARPDAFRFIKDVPTDWEQSRAIAGEVGEYVVYVRQERGGKDWYLGAITDEQARKLDISLDFLPEGQSFQAQIYADGPDADWQTAPYAMTISSRPVQHGDRLRLKLASSGGTAIRFKAL
ncbi:Alpha-glucosidase [Saliniradius amylolyticus]|uniref:Alpha-glucosidase n=1 Tax=Saliniradius amylolyticus TaxID=2183582 RepID=A0A2S2E0E1_9ALTE|nr:glycoside hydrolase family 97 protein [Saliniradius amylolyticus]AWL11069.1 Alpha-glucosidase [Saliniradius amylolyticus]